MQRKYIIIRLFAENCILKAVKPPDFNENLSKLKITDSFLEPLHREHPDREWRRALEGKIGEDFANHGREFEAVARETGSEYDMRKLGMPINNKVPVRRECV